MNVQFNLLPDVKIAFIKAQRQKRLIMSVSIIASIAAVTVFILLLSFVHVAQKKNMSDLTTDIKKTSKDLTETRDINKILTVQNQLGALDTQHSQKVVASRLFDYLQQVTPGQVTIAQLEVDFVENIMTINGGAASLAAINTYTDSLKFTKYTDANSDGQRSEITPFTDVVLSSFARSENRNTYTITLVFDPIIFSQDSEGSLRVPQMVTSRSETERPDTIFEQNGGGQ